MTIRRTVRAGSDPIDIGLAEEIEVTAKTGLVPLMHTTQDRLMLATLLAALVFAFTQKSQNRLAWLALAAALGFFVLPRFLAPFRDDEGLTHWGIANPFGEAGPELLWSLT